MTVFVAVAGDANSPAAWSGIPYHLLDGLKRIGVDAVGMRMEPRARAVRLLWNLGQVLTTGGYQGFQLSETALAPSWGRYHQRLRGHAVINCGQVYPDRIVADPTIRRWYFIDATVRLLLEEFVDYGGPTKIAPRQLERLYDRERRGYERCEGIICHSHWAADSVIHAYGIDPGKVHVVVPGANLDLDHYAHWRQTSSRSAVPTGPLRLVFTGRYPVRKGLDRLLQAMRIAQTRGASLHLAVIGCTRDDVAEPLRDTADVEWLGLVDKRHEADRFNDLLADAEVGCLLSRHECGGIGMREYAAFGKIVLGPDVGGSPDHAGRHRSILVGRDETPEQIAAYLMELAARGDRYRTLRAAAEASMDEVLYTSVARKVAALVGD